MAGRRKMQKQAVLQRLHAEHRVVQKLTAWWETWWRVVHYEDGAEMVFHY